MSDELTQEEADNLLAQHKKYIRHEPVFWPNPGAKVTVDLLSLDEREAFLLDVSRASIKLERLVLQTRARVTVVLVRLDLNGAGHRIQMMPSCPVRIPTYTARATTTNGLSTFLRNISPTCAIGSKPSRTSCGSARSCSPPSSSRGCSDDRCQ